MNLGTHTASLVNHLHSRGVVGQPDPKVGMGATFLSWTDRAAGTIVAVEEIVASRRYFRIAVSHDTAKRIDDNGMSESQTYEYTSNMDVAGADWFQQDKRGMWVRIVRNPETGKWNQSKDGGLRIGQRETYHDFSF